MNMATKSDQPAAHRSPASPNAVWSVMCDLVLDNERRRETSEALGLSFGRIRAIRRLARHPLSMTELAAALGIDAPYATVVIDDLESRNLVARRPHPTDRRTKIVELTRKGKALARRADAILGAPPPGLQALDPDDIERLAEIFDRIAAAAAEPRPVRNPTLSRRERPCSDGLVHTE
jgi:DNA-binding MarR family transcriptional regulator